MNLRLGSPMTVLAAAAVMAVGLVQPVLAQSKSGQPVTFVVGFAAGGVADVIGRMVAERLASKLGGASVVVENRPGASGNIAGRLVATSQPDGHTVLVTTTSIALSEVLNKDKGFSVHDLRAISIPAGTPDAIVVHPSNPAKTLQEFIANAKGKTVNFGTAGAGTSTYISAQYFLTSLAKMDTVHVPFQGGAPAINALLGNHIDAVAVAMPAIVPHVKSGKLRALSLASARRVPALPDVPTHQENGFAGFTSSTWIGLFVPAKTSDEIAGRLNAAVSAVLKDPDFAEKLRSTGFEPNPASLADANAEFKREIESWSKMAASVVGNK